MSIIEPNRIGKVTEYKRGHIYLTHTEWPDGHCEIELHRCCPELIYHSCDYKDLEEAMRLFALAADKEIEFWPVCLSRLPAAGH